MEGVLKIFLENEQNIFKLYSVYSEKFGGRTKLWNDLVEKESEHVDILTGLFEKYGEDESNFEINVHLEVALEYVRNFLKKGLEEAKKENFTLLEAMETSLRLERSLLEKKSFELFRPNIAEIVEVFSIMDKDIEEHIRMIEKSMIKNKY